MKWVGISLFLAVLCCFSNNGNAEEPIKSEAPGSKQSPSAETPSSPIETVGPGQQEAVAGQAPSSPPGPAGPAPNESVAGQGPPSPPEPMGMPEIYFAAATVSADGKYLYIIFDRFLLQYTLPALEMKRKLDLNLAVAPVTPSISISKDSKWLYVISNGILYQIDATTFKIVKQIKIMP